NQALITSPRRTVIGADSSYSMQRVAVIEGCHCYPRNVWSSRMHRRALQRDEPRGCARWRLLTPSRNLCSAPLAQTSSARPSMTGTRMLCDSCLTKRELSLSALLEHIANARRE